MAHRRFVDSLGIEWQVWSVLPAVTQRSLRLDGSDTHRTLPPEYHGGWLVFQSTGERRRLAPIPRGWEQLGIRRLVALLARAHVVPDTVAARVSVSNAETNREESVQLMRQASTPDVPRDTELMRFRRWLRAALDDCGATLTRAVQWVWNGERHSAVIAMLRGRRRPARSEHRQRITSGKRASVRRNSAR